MYSRRTRHTLADPQLPTRMVPAGLAHAAMFSWDASARAVADSYRTYFGLESRA